MRAALDTNVLAYAEGINGLAMQRKAWELIARLPSTIAVLPVQVLGELFNVLTRKAKRTRADASLAVQRWADAFPVADTSASSFLTAIDLSVAHDLSIWDAVIMSVASEADCRLLLTQDLHNGLNWGGVTVVDPFTEPAHELLGYLLDE